MYIEKTKQINTSEYVHTLTWKNYGMYEDDVKQYNYNFIA